MDAALLVLEEGKTSIQDAQHATELLKDTHLIGAVLNNSLSSQAGYGQTGEKSSRRNIPWNKLAGRLHQWTSRLFHRKGN